MEPNINPEDLIILVQERAVLWDKTLNQYKDKQLKVSAWWEVCCQLLPDFANLEEKERQTYGKLVSTKWSNLRDAWMRANKNETKKSGAGAKFLKPYIYKEQMRFLHKIAESNRMHDSVRKRPAATEAPGTPEDLEASETPLSTTSKKQKTLDDKMSQFLDSRLQPPTKIDEHPMLSFFKGVLPNVSSFDDDETLEFQSGVLSLIQKIKKQRESRLYSSNYGWHHIQQSGHISQNQDVHPSLYYNIPPSGAYSTRSSLEPAASPAWSQASGSTRDSEMDFTNI